MVKISWDKYSLKIDGKRIFILAGEFHYWRVPDRERWRDILKMYKIAGLTAVRIYFHWGYHNPAEDNYYFSENRDVDYLLKLCEEIGLLVFIAAGPYICAETSAGGIPGWLLAKRNVKIKHLKKTGVTEYDSKYTNYCKQWYEHFIPNIKSHQVTENPDGCIIAFQIENEYTENRLSSKKYMKELIKHARELGITVPTFHNDFMELGSWNGLVDLNGFDKYPIWAEKFPKEKQIPEWNMARFSKKIDRLEKKVRSFGGAAANSPIFIPELQGGWFNHWGIPYGFDGLYDFYGDTYQKMIFQSIAAQGSTMMILYMFYGGTTWGALANPEVYTSYDYAACIREYGYLSDRLRHVRLFALFAQSFNDNLACTDLIDKPMLKFSERKIFLRQRRSSDRTDFYFFRNFNKKEFQNYTIQFPQDISIPKENSQNLCTKDSFVAIGNHRLNGFNIIFCSLNIILKGNYAGEALLVVMQNEGEILLKGTEFDVKGDLKSSENDSFTRFLFKEEGFGCITNAEAKKLYVVCLSKENALTLNADFSEPDIRLAWGAYSLFFGQKTLEIETIGIQTVWLILSKSNISSFEQVSDTPIPGIKKGIFGTKTNIPEVSLEKWYKIKTDWSNNTSQEIWKEIDFNTERDPIDHHFTSGHVLYKCEFILSNEESLSLNINIRHKAAIWLNGQFIGGHNKYTVNPDQPGTMNGEDIIPLGAENYDLSNYNTQEKNILYVLTENLGHSKMFAFSNDGRNPRGILSAEFSEEIRSIKWYISGTDVTQLKQPYNTAGLPGEKYSYQIGDGEKWTDVEGENSISTEDQIVWYKTRFKWKSDDIKRVPLRIHLEGNHNINIFLNGLYIGRYWGECGPQHDFYIMDNLLKEDNVLVLACWTTKTSNFTISIDPYKIKQDSGNIDDDGIIFATEKRIITL